MRRDGAQAVAAALALFILYACSAPRTVALEDDAFFILSSAFAGVAHPPGYPLYTLLGSAAALVPAGSVAYRIHLLSALCGAAACALVWLCARALGLRRAAAWLAALGLGVSPVFWSQSIIAEVYALNAVLAFGTLLACLRGAPLPAIACLFFLGLANHWPLMLLWAPALGVLLWPRRGELARRLPLIAALAVVALLPYAWMVAQSRVSPIAFYGPIESLREFWFFVSREGYADTDVSPTADWRDRGQFAAFLLREALVQFAVAGTAFAALGCAVQAQVVGRRRAAALALAFVMPGFGLLPLLGFDYDALHQSVMRVYPLPAYGVLALWMALGVDWVAQRRQWRPHALTAVAAVLLAATLLVGAWRNLRAGYDWSERYARAVLESLPPQATLVMRADADIGPIAYFHLVEGVRPDITLYHAQGLLLGNRLFHPMRTTPPAMRDALRALVDAAPGASAFMDDPPPGLAQRHRGLYVLVEPRPGEGLPVIDLPPHVLRFVEEAVVPKTERDPWTRLVQQRLRERFGEVLAAHAVLTGDPGVQRLLADLGDDYLGALGIARGLLAVRAAPRDVARALERARENMPGDAAKEHRARFFELRAYLRLEQGDRAGAVRDLEAAVAEWPAPGNRAAVALGDLRFAPR